MRQSIAIGGLAAALTTAILLGQYDPMAPQPPKATIEIVVPTPTGPADERHQDDPTHRIPDTLIGPDGATHSDCWVVAPPNEDGYAQCKDGYIERP